MEAELLEFESLEEGGDLSLIPENFVEESAESDAPQLPPEETEEIFEEALDISGDDESVEDLETEEFSLSETAPAEASENPEIPSQLKQELKTVLSYMDQLLESLPDDKIEEFARSEYYDSYKKLFKELGLV
jgi:hypothetical protein